MLKLHDATISGNCYKVRLLLSLLELDVELVPVNLKEGEHKSSSFLQLNEWGQVPVLVDRDQTIRDSQAILVYLARQYGGETWLPTEAVSMSQIMQWLSNAANEIANGLAAARVYYLLGRTEIDVDRATQKSHQFLTLLNAHLSNRDWLECGRPTIADIACFPYVALSGDAKVSLEPYPNVRAWIDRIQQLPNYVGMPGL
ncbi:glutathione S-transferase family protein [Phormidesmis sp. 146-35]